MFKENTSIFHKISKMRFKVITTALITKKTKIFPKKSNIIIRIFFKSYLFTNL